MHSETINGLLSVKPGNEPEQGETRTFVIEHRPARNGKKAWIKIKGAGENYGGAPYRILSVEPTGYTAPHGNISFNVDLEPSQGAPQAPANSTGSPSSRQNGNVLDERQRAIIRQHSQSMALELLKLKATLGQLVLEDLSPAKLRLLSDYFDKDVLGSPLSQPHRPVDIDEPSSEDWPPDARYDNPLGTPI